MFLDTFQVFTWLDFVVCCKSTSHIGNHIVFSLSSSIYCHRKVHNRVKSCRVIEDSEHSFNCVLTCTFVLKLDVVWHTLTLDAVWHTQKLDVV